METKRYMKPLVEVAEVSVNGALMSSPVTPVIDNTPMPDPAHPGAPRYRTEIF